MTGSELRQRVLELLDVSEDPQSGVDDWDWVDAFLLALILLNVLAVILETVNSLQLRFSTAFWAFEVFSVGAFSVEYAARIWSCTADPRYRQPLVGRLRYVSSFFGVVDFLAILPFYATLALPASALDLRADTASPPANEIRKGAEVGPLFGFHWAHEARDRCSARRSWRGSRGCCGHTRACFECYLLR